MPLFEYECSRCAARFEALVSSRESPVACARCGDVEVTKLASSFAVGGAAGRERAIAEPGPCGACGASMRGSCDLSD